MFTPKLSIEFRYWECARAAASVRTDADRAAIWTHCPDMTGVNDPLNSGRPQCGYWKTRRGDRWEPVGIWLAEGEMRAACGGEVDPAKIWPHCCRNPVPYDDYIYAIERGKWPGEVTAKMPKLNNFADDPNTQYRQEMVSFLAEVEAFLKSIEEPISLETATSLANYRDRVTATEKEARDLLSKEIAEHKAKIDANKAVWFIPLSSAASIMVRIKMLITPFLRAKEAEGETLRIGGQGTGNGRPRRTGLRSVWRAQVTDWDVVMEQFRENDQVRELVQKLLNAAARSPELRETPIEGCNFVEERTVA